MKLNHQALRLFNGSENYFVHPSGLLFSEKTKFFFDIGGSEILEIIASYQESLEESPQLQIWEFHRDEDGSAVMTLRKSESNPDPFIKHAIHFSDFPLDNLTLHVSNGRIMLPTES